MRRLTAFQKAPTPIVVEVQSRDRSHVVVYGDKRIQFALRGAATPPPAGVDFAVWCVLPLAMRSGQDITFSGPVSRRTIENAQSLVDIWSMWVPEKYAPISVSAQDFIEDSSPRIGSALLFSGGVDSTFGLVSEKVKQDIRIAVTAHGLDYDSRKNDQFDQLIQRTQALLDKYVVEHVIVETNAGRIVGDLGLTHAFLLASCLFLGGAGSEKGLIAADLTLPQEMMVFPWGTNHVTNNLFASGAFAMHTVSYESERIQKLEALSGDTVALTAISCCGRKEHRPNNCGVCAKCMRSKCMFLALSGRTPPIFLDNEISEGQIRQLDVASREAYKHYSSIFRVARDRNNLDALPGLKQHLERSMEARRRASARRAILRKIGRVFHL